MKKLILLFICTLTCVFLSAQNVQWTWISGDSTFNNVDVYGNRRMPDSANKPGCIAPVNSWTDSAGNFYMFGGMTLTLRFGFDTIPVPSNALWKYDPVLKMWAMVTGGNGQTPDDAYGAVYGTRGIPAPGNTPQLLRNSGTAWTDVYGKLWLFGGKTGYRNQGTNGELWKFDPVIGQWTFFGGCSSDCPPAYGAKGIFALTNTPGARAGATMWNDRKGGLYAYGGSIQSPYVTYGDVWKYDSSANQWAWVSGRQWYSGISDGPVYGTPGVFAAGNTPGASGGCNCMLGGPDSNGIVPVRIANDMWHYSVNTDQWAWISRDSAITSNPKREYGIKGVPSPKNNPGTRNNAAQWNDAAGNRWVFGGFIENGISSNSYLNDLWKYTPATRIWVWLGGDSSINRAPDFGVKGMPSANNQPGGRSDSKVWKDGKGDVWLFGGLRKRLPPGTSSVVYNKVNDLWKLSIQESNLPTKWSGFSAAQKEGVVVLQWSTLQEQGSKEFIVQRSPDSIQFTSIGTVSAAGNTVSVSRYEFIDNAPLTGNNFYRLKQANLDDTFEYSAIAKVFIAMPGFTYSIMQNPVQQELILSFQADQAVTVQVQVKDAAGHLLLTTNKTVAPGASTYTVPLHRLAAGIHFISVIKDRKIITRRFIKS